MAGLRQGAKGGADPGGTPPRKRTDDEQAAETASKEAQDHKVNEEADSAPEADENRIFERHPDEVEIHPKVLDATGGLCPFTLTKYEQSSRMSPLRVPIPAIRGHGKQPDLLLGGVEALELAKRIGATVLVYFPRGLEDAPVDELHEILKFARSQKRFPEPREVKMSRSFHARETKLAKDRMEAGARREAVENAGKATARVAAALGMSETKYRQCVKLIEAADDEDHPEHVAGLLYTQECISANLGVKLMNSVDQSDQVQVLALLDRRHPMPSLDEEQDLAKFIAALDERRKAAEKECGRVISLVEDESEGTDEADDKSKAEDGASTEGEDSSGTDENQDQDDDEDQDEDEGGDAAKKVGKVAGEFDHWTPPERAVAHTLMALTKLVEGTGALTKPTLTALKSMSPDRRKVVGVLLARCQKTLDLLDDALKEPGTGAAKPKGTGAAMTVDLGDKK